MTRLRLVSTAAILAFLAVPAAYTFGQDKTDKAATGDKSELYQQLNLFGDVLERVRRDYVEPVDEKSLMENAINGMLASLDPHSSYMNPKAYKDMQVQTRGEFGGLGIEVTMENSVIKVVSPIDDTPASKAGIQPGDLIFALDGQPVMGMTLQEAVDKMRGKIGAPIKISLRRANVKDPIDVTLNREVIKVKSTRYHLEGDVGYIRVTSFTEQSTSGVLDAVEKMKKESGGKIKGYVLDLRNNPGGLLDQAISMCDAFMDRGAGERRLGLGVGDRGRRPAGPASRHHPRHPFLRQRLGADHHAGDRRRRDPPHDGALLHAVGPLDPEGRHQARHRGRTGQGRDHPAAHELP